MPTIDPKYLLKLRNTRGLTRARLAEKAGISERQIARIEDAHDVANVRDGTVKGLARALDVTVAALKGDEPLPADIGDAAAARPIDPQTLRLLREAKGLTRAELAEMADLSDRQVARLESHRSHRIRSRSKTCEALAAALDTNVQTLASPPPSPTTQDEPVHINFRLSPQLRFAFDLVRHRYGPTRREIVELAPLLFTLLAEGCLHWRRQCLEEIADCMARLENLADTSQLYFAKYLVDKEHGASGVGTEDRSINEADLLGDVVRAEAGWPFHEDDLGNVTPFADYLIKFASDLNIDGVVDFLTTDPDAEVGSDTIWGAEPYQICRKLLAGLAGNSTHARWALIHGDVSPSKIPGELMGHDASNARIAWLESQLSDKVRRKAEDQEQRTHNLLMGLIRDTTDILTEPQSCEIGDIN